jgi:poly-gamma-glutamate synthesis protein (capsule biosynthesis protein)
MITHDKGKLMKKIILILSTFLTTGIFADAPVQMQPQFNANISEITPEVKQRMLKGKSWRKGCPVSLTNLRYLQMNHLNFNGGVSSGEMIVHKDVAEEVVFIFEDLFKMNYAIDSIKLVSDFKGNDWQSIEAGNTSAFNCRKATGSKNWSKHSYGKAIDINPIENPYIARSGHISHKASEKYRKRRHKNLNNLADRALLLTDDYATMAFKNYGWKWGGDWSGVKDYQHFAK